MDLADKVVLITGGARGIGLAMAHAFAAKGARLVLTDIDEEQLAIAENDIKASDSWVKTMKIDVAREADVERMVAQTIDEAGQLDVLISNAGVSASGPAELMPMDDWRWITDINMWAHVYAVRAALPYFKERGSGHLVHVSSAAGILGTPALSAYCMTKFAVFGLAESLAVSLHGSGIGVTLVCPLWVDTDIALHGRVTMDPSLDIDSEKAKELSREMVRSAGIPAEKVADETVAAVEEGRFLVLPHPEVQKFARRKWDDPERYIARAAETLKATQSIFGGS
ncbi:MAG TPA: SDR family oxidoreductase [Actinomycetota bacterium]|nr:SDR family oxidoreductase [Actinomycetota bacterium]